MNRILTLNNVIEAAPAIVQNNPYHKLSDKYNPYPTIKFIEHFMKLGWQPTKAVQVKSRGDRAGFQKHMIKFQHPETRLTNDERLELVLVNSTDGSCSYQLLLGVFRMICSNGAIVGDHLYDMPKIRHMGHSKDDVLNLSDHTLSLVPKITNNVVEMKQIELSDLEKEIFAASCLPLIEEEKKEINPLSLLRKKRYEDSLNDLWTTFNVVQENIIKGGISTYNSETKKYRKTRAIKQIDKDIKLNKALWTLAEEMKKLKKAA